MRMNVLCGMLALLCAGGAYAADEDTCLWRAYGLCDRAPIDGRGAALFTYKNSSGLDDGDVYLQVVGENPVTGVPCFVKYDEFGKSVYADVSGPMDSGEYAFPLSMLPEVAGERSFYLPKLLGARLYTSISKKMVFMVSKNADGKWTISAPNPLNPSDPNRSILWDKTEFAVDTGAVFINPTAVDNFSLSLHCAERGKDGSVQSGGLQEGRTDVFNKLRLAFASAGAPWPSLISGDPSLVYSPMFASATGNFPQDLFLTSGWMDAFKKVFSVQPLLVDVAESLPIEKGGGIWKGIVDVETGVITFNREIDEMHPEVAPSFITLPTETNQLLGGNGPSWKIETGNVLQEVFARNISCAIDTNTLTTGAPLSQKYFDQVRDSFYQVNGEMPHELQFYDHYSQVLHSYGNHLIYTLPYDDELGQSGSASYTPANFVGGSIELGPL